MFDSLSGHDETARDAIKNLSAYAATLAAILVEKNICTMEEFDKRLLHVTSEIDQLYAKARDEAIAEARTNERNRPLKSSPT